MDDNQNEIAKSMSGRRNNQKEEVECKSECIPLVNDNDIKPVKKSKRREGRTLGEDENDKGDEKSDDINCKTDKGKTKENERNANQEKENDNGGEDGKDKIKESDQEVKENEVTTDKHGTSKNKDTNKGKEAKESTKERGSGSLKKSDSKSGKDNENKSSKSSQKKNRSDHSEKDNALKSDETIRSYKSNSQGDEGGDKKKKSSKKKKSGKGADKDPDKREDESSDRKKEKRESVLKAATRRDFCTDTEDDEDSGGKGRSATKRRDDGEDKPRGRESWERKRDDYEYRRGRNVDDESYCKIRGCERRRRSDRCDDYQQRDVSNNFCIKDCRESMGCFLGELCSGGKKSSYREVRISKVDCSKREKDGRRDMCLREGRKDPCNFVPEGKRNSWRELTDRKRDTCKQCGKERTDRDGTRLREYEERRGRQRKPESRDAVEGYGRDQYREDTETWKTSFRDDRRDWYRDEHYGKRDLHRDGKRESSSAECDARREGSGMEREGGRGGRCSGSGNGKNGFVDESGQRREGRRGNNNANSCLRDEKDRREFGRSEDGEDKNTRNDCNTRRSENQWTKDEIYRLKDELVNLQTELEQMRACLKTAITLAERNKCTMTKLKEHLQCNLPDFAKIREKLRECQLLRLRLCGENTANKTNWKKDFEFLICELNAVKCELENVKKEKM